MASIEKLFEFGFQIKEISCGTPNPRLLISHNADRYVAGQMIAYDLLGYMTDRLEGSDLKYPSSTALENEVVYRLEAIETAKISELCGIVTAGDNEVKIEIPISSASLYPRYYHQESRQVDKPFMLLSEYSGIFYGLKRAIARGRLDVR